jgi:hypothetical protein
MILFVLSSAFATAQEYGTVSESRKTNLISVLNYRYKGGFYTLEKHFNNSVSFPDVAKYNCRVGICIVSVYVDCEGVVQKVSIKNPLRYGIDVEVSKFFNSTAGNWNPCSDERYTKFDIPIQFTLTGTKTNTTTALLIHEGEGIIGEPCEADEYYMKRAEKMLKKKNGKKAMEPINILLMRDPYNNQYYEMRKEALGYMKE